MLLSFLLFSALTNLYRGRKITICVASFFRVLPKFHLLIEFSHCGPVSRASDCDSVRRGLEPGLEPEIFSVFPGTTLAFPFTNVILFCLFQWYSGLSSLAFAIFFCNTSVAGNMSALCGRFVVQNKSSTLLLGFLLLIL